ncbi:MAG: hypothetical protein FJY82_11390 [Candidatus Aminicenantes bacterium]|nr:hypothetical protein [Candidatus Aminicenantes bacterium]
MKRALSAVLAALLLPAVGCRSEKIEGRRMDERTISTAVRSSVPDFKTLFGLIRATLARGRAEFPGRTGPVTGFAAGTDYPQVWLRDSATIIPASKYFYPASYLVSWIEEHLALQRPDGSLVDWVDAAGRSDKNTTETDQEASAVLAAAEASGLVGSGWLDTPVEGVPVIDRLEAALRFVFESRFDASRGLVTGAHTPDWGDVGLEAADQTAVYVDDRTNWTCDIYDQAIVHGACLALAGLWEARDRPEKARAWRTTAEALRRNADRHLWQEDRGYYRVHFHLGALKHDFDEDAIFPMGGNAEAVLRGLASEDKARRIFETAMARQAEHKMPTVSASLLPPYPAGVFRHPMVDQPFEYQNGGLWDWFGGKLVAAMFENGFSAAARLKLLEIARKAAANKGLFEWDAPDGTGRGSPYFAGSAGSLAKALIEGYFGIHLSRDDLELSPRLGEDSARLQVRLPAAGVFAAYDYRWNPAERRITFRFESSIRKKGRLRITLPPALAATEASAGRERLAVSLDGRPVPFAVERRDNDAILVVKTDFTPQTLDIRPAK